MIVRDLLGTGTPAVAFASVDLAFDRFGESLTLVTLQKAIPRIRGDAKVGDDPEDVDFLAAQRLGCWLNQSIELGYQSCAKLLLANGADPNNDYQDADLATEQGHVFGRPLAIAAEAEDAEIAKLLIDHGAILPPRGSWEDETNDGLSCGHALLCAAAEHPHLVSFARRLIDEGAHPEECGNAGAKPLARALAANNIDMAALFLEHGARLFMESMREMSDPHWDTQLNHAAKSWSVDTVEWLLSVEPEFRGSPRLKGRALTESIRARNIPAIELLVARAARISEIHITESLNHNLPLAIVRLLIKHATTDEAGEENWAVERAFDMAARQGKVEILRCFLHEDGMKPKWLSIAAVVLGRVECVQLMLAAGADPNTPASAERFGNALYHAAKKGSMELVQLLLAHGAIINHTPRQCGDALQIAAERGHESIARLLLARGAEVRPSGMSPFAKGVIQRFLGEAERTEN